MKLQDVDLTASEYFSRRPKGPDSAASPRHKLNAYGPRVIMGHSETVHSRSCRPTMKAPDVLKGGVEDRMLSKNLVPLIFSGNKEEIERKESMYQSLDSNFCDCCGRRIQRLPRQIVEQEGGLCPVCSVFLAKSFGPASVQGPWTIIYGPDYLLHSDSQFYDDSLESIHEPGPFEELLGSFEEMKGEINE